ncbi:hypothetical protein GT360_00605 [Vibrio astriarenae]|uniref:Uncharacterized protein n=1 Tax=Vibrio astriarenae TaxID=1481923 RepID=A0A7Z2T573_9VIBR|nr:hypothetical protein GT360_00605 [Vibrio astriarenae]
MTNRQRKTPRACAHRGYSLTRSNPATNRCSLHLFLDSRLKSVSLILSSPS